MISLILLSLAPIYRPYLDCEGVRPLTHIEVKQNTQPENGMPLYTFTMKKRVRGKSIETLPLAADRIPDKRKQVIERISAVSEKGTEDYDLTVFTFETGRGYRSVLMDHDKVRNVYCTYHENSN